jgi:hypothetical protein
LENGEAGRVGPGPKRLKTAFPCLFVRAGSRAG